MGPKFRRAEANLNRRLAGRNLQSLVALLQIGCLASVLGRPTLGTAATAKPVRSGGFASCQASLSTAFTPQLVSHASGTATTGLMGPMSFRKIGFRLRSPQHLDTVTVTPWETCGGRRRFSESTNSNFQMPRRLPGR